MLAVCVWYFSPKKHSIVTTFLKMAPLGESLTSESIGEAICKVIKDSCLTLEKLIGIGVYGCSTMVGVHHSHAMYFRELVPHIVIFKCVCHSLQLAASKASDTIPAHLDFIVRESYNWFAHSPKRLFQYRELQKCITSEIPLKLLITWWEGKQKRPLLLQFQEWPDACKLCPSWICIY